MEWVKRGLMSDGVFEALVIIWIVAGPLAIAGWVGWSCRWSCDTARGTYGAEGRTSNA